MFVQKYKENASGAVIIIQVVTKSFPDVREWLETYKKYVSDCKDDLGGNGMA